MRPICIISCVFTGDIGRGRPTITLILQMRKRRHREMHSLGYIQTAAKWQSPEANSRSSTGEPTSPTTLLFALMGESSCTLVQADILKFDPSLWSIDPLCPISTLCVIWGYWLRLRSRGNRTDFHFIAGVTPPLTMPLWANFSTSLKVHFPYLHGGDHTNHSIT